MGATITRKPRARVMVAPLSLDAKLPCSPVVWQEWQACTFCPKDSMCRLTGLAWQQSMKLATDVACVAASET